MNFQQLEYALAVHHTGHFGNAAENCNITQATLSAMIKKLEEEIGYVLFDRSKKPVQTTEDGIEFMSVAIKILEQKNQLFEIDQTKKHGLTGAISIGVIPTVANSLLPLFLPTILEENPNLELTIKEITTEEIQRQLYADKLDFGILATPLDDEKIIEDILYYEPMLVFGSLEKEKQYVSSNDIKDGKIWLLEEGHCFRNQMVTVCSIEESKRDPQNLNFQGNSFETLLNLTEQFGGFTLIPELYQRKMEPKRLEKVKPFQVPIPVREISLVSYRPYAKKSSIEYLSNKIRNIVSPLLSTINMKASELDIIGI